MSIDFNSLDNAQSKNLLVVVLDSQGRIIFLNKAMEVFIGRSFKDVKELKFWDLCANQEDIETIKDNFTNFDSEHFPKKQKINVVTQDGTGQDIKWTNNILLNKDDQIDRVICFGKSLTEYDEYDFEEISPVDTKISISDKKDNKHLFCITNDRGRILDINDSYCEFTGYSKQELLKMSIFDIDGNHNRDNLAMQIQKAIAEGHNSFNTRQKNNDGKIAEIVVNANYTQNFGGLLFLSIETSNALNTEHILDKNRPEFRQYLRAQILDKVSEMVSIHDLNDNFIYANETMYKILGYSKKELFDMKFHQLISPEYLAIYEDAFKNLLDKGEISIECEYICKKGNLLGIALFAQVMSAGNQSLILTVAREISKKTEPANDSNLLINNITEALSIIDRDCNILNCNDMFCNLCGHELNQLIGTPIDELIVTNGSGKLKNYLGVVEKGNSQFFTALLKHKNGKTINVEIGAKYIPGDSGKFFTMIRNITKQKLLTDGYQNSLKINTLLNNNLKDIIIYRATFHPKLKFEYISDSVYSLLGYSAQELYENPDIVSTIYFVEDKELIKDALVSGKSSSNPITLRCRRKDGNIISMEAHIKPVYDGNKKLTGIDGNLKDINLRISLESKLKKESEYINALKQSTELAICTVSKNHDITWMNSKARQLFGEYENRKCYQVLYNSRQVCAKCKLNGANGTEQTDEIIKINNEPADSPVEYQITSIPIASEHGEINELIKLLVPLQKKQTAPQYVDSAEPESPRKHELIESSYAVLCDMNESLNSCISIREAGKIISRQLPLLFPEFDGSLFLYNHSTNSFEPLVAWGNKHNSTVFSPESCIAIRKNKKHIVTGKNRDDVCHHVDADSIVEYMEVPVIYHGDKIGLLYIQRSNVNDQTSLKKTMLTDGTKWLAQVIADQLAAVLTSIKLHETIQELSKYDPVTNLFNRKYMESALEKEITIAAGNSTRVGLMVLNLENFNDFVEVQGYKSADLTLHNFATLIKNTCTAEEIICRCDGNKFAIIIPHTSQEYIKQKAMSLYEITKLINIGDKQRAFVPLQISFGIAMFPNHGAKADDIIRVAYNNIYANRKRGINAREASDTLKESVKTTT